MTPIVDLEKWESDTFRDYEHIFGQLAEYMHQKVMLWEISEGAEDDARHQQEIANIYSELPDWAKDLLTKELE